MQMTAAARRTFMLTAVSIAAAALALAGCKGGAAAGGTGGGEYADDMGMGSPTAKVTVVEYASPTCPHCAHFAEEIFPAFKAKYIDTGKVRYFLRELPIHAPDGPAYLLARCVGKDKYFSVVDAMWRSLPKTEAESASWDVRSVLLKIAASNGMSESQALNCMGDADQINKMNTRVERESKQYDVNSTPTFIVNGKKLEGETEVDLPRLDGAIQPLLAKKG
jgi:protein-disulfide isomerase